MAREKKRITLDFYTDDAVDKMLYDYIEDMGIKSKAIKNIIFEHMNNVPVEERNVTVKPEQQDEQIQQEQKQEEVPDETFVSAKKKVGGFRK